MAFSAKLELRQGQQLVMTPQLQQAIRLLQFSNLELNAFVETELERNPLLERDETDSSDLIGAVPTLDEAAANIGVEAPQAGEEWLDLTRQASDVSTALDTEIENVYPDSSVGSQDLPTEPGWASLKSGSGASSAPSGDGDYNLEQFVAVERSLRDHLTWQLHLAISDPVLRLIGQTLIDHVDDAGYLITDTTSVAERLGAPLAQVAEVLSLLQTFDPVGVCARNLAECLTLQLKDRNRFDPMIERLLANLHLVAEHDIAALRRAVGCDGDDLADMIGEIKQLCPKPGLVYGSTPVQPVVPDVLVRPASDSGWVVELNTETLPKVLVNRSYYTKVSKAGCSPRDKSYLLECLQTANWLTKSLDQRARTILKVAEEIVRQQDAFFTHGVRYLRPLNLKTIADAISMHESTVSRVTSNKYMSTPRGIFELKYFFTSAIASSGDGEALSSESVRHRIKELIESEAVADVLSDDAIVDKLRSEGIDIARRTVAKYREGMRIPSSVQRRRQKRISGQIVRIA
jgi:RNA polymerase sigma-54 factor